MQYSELLEITQSHDARLIAVSKMQPDEKIIELYHQGQRDFGENKVQEILRKKTDLPFDIRWHLIGHLQTNKVKKIITEVVMIQSVDSLKLLQEIQKQAAKNELNIDCLLQMHIAKEDTKYGLDQEELDAIIKLYLDDAFPNVVLRGMMGMASLTTDQELIRQEFETLQKKYQAYQSKLPHWDTLSMGMSSDYLIALDCGSTMIRVGSIIFGSRNYT